MVLPALRMVAVLSTAAFVHYTWKRTASENVERIVSRLDAQRASTVRAELSATFAVLASTAEIVRSILFQGTIKAEDEVKREFLFLSLLREQPVIGWIGFGFPDGRFFGSHAAPDGKIEMVANTGTYLDSPFHRYEDGKDLSQLSLDTLANLEAVVVRIPDSAGRAIAPAAFKGVALEGKAVLVQTGWDVHWRTERYLSGHPFLTASTAEFLLDQGVTLVGIDSLNIDDTDDPRRFDSEMMASLEGRAALLHDEAREVAQEGARRGGGSRELC
jgi:hypothetical protein